MAESKALFTLGHSNHPQVHFESLLAANDIDVLVDVRSWPRSRFVEWADRSRLPGVADGAGARYLFLGDHLGGRPDGSEFYDDQGRVLYSRISRTDSFVRGIARLERGIEVCRVAIMCSEEDPSSCHRRLLVAKVMLDRGVAVSHIRGDGSNETETEPICFSVGSLLDDEEVLWRSSRSVLRKRARSTSLTG